MAAIVPTALNSIIARGGEGIDDARRSARQDDRRRRQPSTPTPTSTPCCAPPGSTPPTTCTASRSASTCCRRCWPSSVDAVIGGFQNIEGAQLAARGVAPGGVPGRPLRRAQLRRAGGGGQQRAAARRRRLPPRRCARSSAALAAGTAYAKAHPQAALAVMRANSSRDYRDVLATSVPGHAAAARHDHRSTRRRGSVRPLDAVAGPARRARRTARRWSPAVT